MRDFNDCGHLFIKPPQYLINIDSMAKRPLLCYSEKSISHTFSLFIQVLGKV